MQHIDVSKKRPARWPWLLGLVFLVFVIWGVTVLLRPDPAPEPPATVPTAADTLPPAMIPSQSQGAVPVRDGSAGGAAGEAADEEADAVDNEPADNQSVDGEAPAGEAPAGDGA